MKHGTRVIMAGAVMLVSCALGSGCSSGVGIDPDRRVSMAQVENVRPECSHR